MVKKEKMKLDTEELEFLTDGLQSGDYDMNTEKELRENSLF